MQLSSKDIDHLAKLARLDLKPVEREKFSAQISHILEYVEKLQSVDTRAISAAAVISPLEKFRADEVSSDNLEDKLIAGAPETEAGAIKTPPIL